ncbi:MAG: hypothetical protein HY747_08500 [Elusimicrobia bacterium]|nr:hypothetical protein [Elusimicrobiota bacterium]
MKFHPRKKWQNWHRKHLLAIVFKSALGVFVLAGAGWAAVKAARSPVFFVNSFEIGEIEVPAAVDIKSAWMGRHRLWCALNSGKLIEDLLEKYPSLEEIRLRRKTLLVDGKVRFDFTFRSAAARVAVRGKTKCLDRQAVSFPCRPDFEKEQLLVVPPDAAVPLLSGILKAAETMSAFLDGSCRLAKIERFGPAHLVFSDNCARSYEFAGSDVLDAGCMDAVLRRLAVILADLREKNEKFRYIDAVPADEGRIIVQS